jgi:transposase
MFVRLKKQPGGKVKIQIVESIRDSGKIRQRLLRHVGTVSGESELEQFKTLAEHIRAEMERERQPSLFPTSTLASMVVHSREISTFDVSPLPVNLRQLREDARIVTGIHDIYGSLYDAVGYGSVMKCCPVSAPVMKDMVMARLSRPCSKRSSCEFLERDFGIQIPLEKIYRMMDTLNDEKIQKLQDISWAYSRELFTEEIDLFFYDCTTLYFESFTEDELRCFGYSKDLKFNQGQVLLALMVTRQGLPAGYEVFPGNMYEGATFKTAIERIKKRYKVKRAVVVADSGLLSKENIALLEKEKLEYIIGARLKSLSEAWQDTVLDHTDYQKVDNDGDLLRLANHKYSKTRRLIVSHSVKRGEKDRRDREKAIEKLKEKLQKSKNPKTLISNYGYKKYLQMEGELNVTVNNVKLQRETQWDGLHGIFTNIIDLTPKQIYSQYHGLWQVEESFRIGKHDIRLRPVFHWSARRIHAHIAICFVAFSLIRFLQHKLLEQTGDRLSAERIRDELYRVQDSIVLDTSNNNKYVIPSKPSKDAIKLYDMMNKRRQVTPFRLNTSM